MKPKKKTIKKTTKPQSPLRVGNTVFIRAVTHYTTGKIVLLTRDEVVLDEAAWIADSGRWSTVLQTGSPNEVEPYPAGVLVTVGRGAIVDACDWRHALPRTQK
jgi:hypothetical protein